ncbi:patatin-like protein [Amycolatopsis sp. RTGN1]|uniref:patatin-like protein n=1 Tax=Amycolatopsis ponsaeliensis TaxID=2992142 RepID=UPI00254A5519|nr:patatin-like protein [Amycolatopsis sp. RTGN1]
MAEGRPPWPQEIRIAMTMTGGSSLAVWMGGVAAEVSELLQASRSPGSDGPYQRLLGLLDATVSLDVLTGTSAGGINAAVLGLAEAYRTTPEILRDIWLDSGSLLDLVRDPAEREPRSLLDGDRVLLGGLDTALNHIAARGRPPAGPSDITVLLTSTMIDGENVRFDDALGNMVRDSDHRLLFRFRDPQWTDAALRPLALAARSTASFPGAFELSYLPITREGADPGHPDLKEYTSAARSHWLTDGGVLLNKPIRPALREIFERPAEVDVRRLLLYVVPTGETPPAVADPDPAKPPLLGNALIKVVSAVMHQSISAELDDIDRHNDAVDRVRGTRVSLAAVALSSGPQVLMTAGLMAEYRDRRVQDDAATLVREATRLLDRVSGPDAGAAWASGRATGLREAAVAGLSGDLPSMPPGEVPTDVELRAFRTTALDDAVATGLQLVNAGFRRTPDRGQAETLNAGRAALHKARAMAARPLQLTDWVARQDPPKNEPLTTWVGDLARKWAYEGSAPALDEAWRTIAEALRETAPVLHDLAVAPAADDVSGELRAEAEAAGKTIITLLTWLDLPSAGQPLEVCGRLLTLHIATRGLLAQLPSVDQRVDLVQVSADSRTLLDLRRQRASQKLTAMQAGHFGAFYKSSWRANDWMWGRIDAVGWLMQCLLEPARLRLITPDVVANAFRSLDWRPPSIEDELAPEEVEELRTQLNEELAFLGLDADLGPVTQTRDLPASMPVTAMVLARSRQITIAGEELPVVANRARTDAEVAKGNGKPSQAFRELMAKPVKTTDGVQRAFRSCRISAETLGGERGTPLLTTTLVKAGATSVNAAAGAGTVPSAVRPAARLAQATGRSAWWVARGAAQLRAPWNLLAALIAALAGLVIGNESGPVLQWVGLPVTAGAILFLLISVFTLGRSWKGVVGTLAAAVGICLLSAAYVPPIRELLFPWLINLMTDWRHGEHAVWWLVVSALLLVPAATTPATATWHAVTERRRRRRLRARPNSQGRIMERRTRPAAITPPPPVQTTP